MKNWIKSALLGAFLVCAAAGSAYGMYELRLYKIAHHSQNILIQSDHGGYVDDYEAHYAASRKRGDLYKIDGLCISACTFITGTIPVDRVCITKYARMGFHAAWYRDDDDKKQFADDGTSIGWQLFSPEIIALLKKKGWNGPEQNQDKLIWVGFDELKQIYRVCGPKE